MVIYGAPTPAFTEVVEALAAQDYPSLQHLFFLVGVVDNERIAYEEQLQAVFPSSVVRSVAGNPGYGPTQTEAARLVEGESGLFLFLHDDVALAPDAVSQLVTEMFRSNAGVVGPKLVAWDDPSILQHVGMAVDRCGEIDPIVLPGEKDQEQHDAVADVFCVPSACMLVRADLFRTIGGFSPDITFAGEELDLCWRVHLTGGRVVVVPNAVARHREQFAERNATIDIDALRERNRVNTVLTCTAASRLFAVVPQLVALAVLELVVGFFVGGWRRAVTALGAIAGSVLRTRGVLSRRRIVQATRTVSDAEVHDLQVRGSARVVSFVRQRRALGDQRRHESRVAANERERKARTSALVISFLVLGLLIGSRRLITGGIAHVGQFVPFTESWRSLGSAYRMGWWPAGFGSVSPAPTGTALVAVASFFSLGNPALVRTVFIVGLLAVAAGGMWRLSSSFSSSRARSAGVASYLVLPLGYECIATGRWGALACFAAAPWFLASLHSAREVLTATASDVARRSAALGVLLALVTAFEPSFLPVALLAAIVWFFAGFVSSGIQALRGAPSVLGAGVVVSLLLHIPWISHYARSNWWESVVGADLGVGRDIGAFQLATFDFGRTLFAPVALVFYGVVVVAVLVSRDERFVWAIRASLLSFVFLGVAFIGDTRLVDIALPDPAVLLVFVALGLALGAATIVESFDVDIRGQRFGWQQPVGLLALVAVILGAFPFVVNAAGGRWHQPSASLSSLYAQMPQNPDEGDYRVLFLGNPDLLPGAATTINQPANAQTNSQDTTSSVALGYVVTDDGPATLVTQWAPGSSSAVGALEETLRHLVSRDTPRVGRLLAPLGVRYVVVPLIDGARSQRTQTLPVPDGLLESLRVQLDFRRQYFANDLVIYENTSWVPTLAQLTAEGVTASKTAGSEELVLSDLRGATPVKSGFVPGRATQKLKVGGGTVSAAVPYSARWGLSVNGKPVPSRPAFGATQAFDIAGDVPAETTATLRFDRPALHVGLVIGQFALWVVAFFVASGLKVKRRNKVAVVLEGGSGVLAFSVNPKSVSP
jgi:GT2 family glycosyltransferase